jgi:hypothetical protein
MKDDVVRKGMNFGEALKVLKNRGLVCRLGWNGKGMFLGLREPGRLTDMDLPYIFMSTVDRKLVPWLASQTDLLAEDW